MSDVNLHPQNWPPEGRGALAEHRCRGIRHGRAICLYMTGGVAWEGHYEHDAPIGCFRFYAPDGALVGERYFNNKAVRLPTFMREASCAAS
jgi:hypothetical protein